MAVSGSWDSSTSCPRWEWALQRNRTRCLARKHPRWQSAVSVLCPEDAGRAIPEKRALQPFLPRAHLLQGSVPETAPQAQQRLDVSALSFHLPSCRKGTVHCLLTSSALIWAMHRQIYENNVSQRLFRVSASYFSISSSDFYCWAFLGFVCFILLTASALKKKKKLLCTLESIKLGVRVVCVWVNAICGECLSVVLTVKWYRKKERISSLWNIRAFLLLKPGHFMIECKLSILIRMFSFHRSVWHLKTTSCPYMVPLIQIWRRDFPCPGFNSSLGHTR